MTLSRSDTAFLKGIAIMMIVLHNFCHWLPRCVVENEYSFDASRIQRYVDYLSQGGPHLVLNFFSHYGHYGVPLFLFLSGYGLVKKYESKANSDANGFLRAAKGDLTFVWQHMVKLWKLMIPALLIYWFTEQTLGDGWRVKPTDLLAMVTYTSNLFYNRFLILGPWWFFSLILQLYIVYRFVLYHFRSTAVLLGVALFCFLLQTFCYYCDFRMTPGGTFYLFDTTPTHWDLFNYCRYNFPTSMLPFAIGIWWSRRDNAQAKEATSTTSVLSRTTLVAMTVGAVLLLAAAFNSMLWLVSPIFLLVALVPLAHIVKTQWLRTGLEWIGRISSTLFAVHPIVRAYTIDIAKDFELSGDWGCTLLVIVCYVVVSIAAAYFLSMAIKQMSNIKLTRRA